MAELDILSLEIDYEDRFDVYLEDDTLFVSYSEKSGRHGKTNTYKKIGDNKSKIVKIINSELKNYGIEGESVTEIFTDYYNIFKTLFEQKNKGYKKLKKLNEKYEDIVLRGFLAGALFTGVDAEEEPLDSNFSIKDFDKDSLRKAKKIVDHFLLSLGSDPDVIVNSVKGQDYEALGIDLWMTMTGQGVGFWDGDWKEFGDELTDVAKRTAKKFYVEGATTFDGNKVEIF